MSLYSINECNNYNFKLTIDIDVCVKEDWITVEMSTGIKNLNALEWGQYDVPTFLVPFLLPLSLIFLSSSDIL